MICNHCFEDINIRDYIESNGEQSNNSCPNCGAQSDPYEEMEVYLLEKRLLAEKLVDIVQKLYTHENVHGLGGSARSHIERGEDPNDLAGLSDLDDVCENIFGDNQLSIFIVDNRPFVDMADGDFDYFESPYHTVWKHRCFFEDDNGYRLSEWKNFCKNVKHKARYFDHPEFSVTGILSEFDIFFQQLVTYSDQTYIYRSRKINNAQEERDIDTNPAKELGKVPVEHAKNNRFSPVGISYGYFAFDERTAVAEIRPEHSDNVAIGTFLVPLGLRFIDFRRASMERALDYFDDDFNDRLYCQQQFISEFIADISRPISSDEQLLEYIPTQIMAEFIWSRGYDGFLFDSSLTGGTNLVLFEEKYDYESYRKVIADILYGFVERKFDEKNAVPKASSSTESREAIPIQGEPKAYQGNYLTNYLNKR